MDALKEALAGRPKLGSIHVDHEQAARLPLSGRPPGKPLIQVIGGECQQGANKVVSGAKAKTNPSTTPPFLG
ncbi:hypothetical protein A7982_13409 [Minicystis rosea]|nr:hypothetical protein A7982_13409 [Minicystis rosea]